MSFVGDPFSYDLFVSYSHGAARQEGRSRLASWSERLAEELVIELKDVEPDFDALDLFIDKKLDPTLNLTPQLQDKVKDSALLVVIMSPRYLASSWCQDELAWFEAEIKRRQKNEGCVLVVRAIPTKHEAWPTCLKDDRGHTVLGFLFHPEPTDEETRPFGWAAVSDSDDPNFIRALSSLSGMIQRRLYELREHRHLRDAEEAELEETVVDNPVVFLYARPEDHAAWATTRDTLAAAGYIVRPEKLPDVKVNGGIDAMFEASMQRVQACIDAQALLILRPTEGDWIVDHLRATGRMELEQVEALRKRPLPCAVLNQVDGDLPALGGLNFDTIRGQGKNWLPELKDWLDTMLQRSLERVG